MPAFVGRALNLIYSSVLRFELPLSWQAARLPYNVSSRGCDLEGRPCVVPVACARRTGRRPFLQEYALRAGPLSYRESVSTLKSQLTTLILTR